MVVTDVLYYCQFHDDLPIVSNGCISGIEQWQKNNLICLTYIFI